MKKIKIFVCCTEQSGENICSNILSRMNMDKYQFDGVCGKQSEKYFSNKIYDLSEFKSIGLFEIILSISKYLKMIRKLKNYIIKNDYDLVLTIDSPDFNYNLVNQLRKSNYRNKIIHVVAPTVWAWRSYRARKFAKIFDEIFLLFNFEKKFFNFDNLNKTFIGHPIFHIKKRENKGKKKYLSFLPGSRQNEVLKLMKYFSYIEKYISESNINYKIFIPTLPHLASLIKENTKQWKTETVISTDMSKFDEYYRDVYISITCSGTASLEIAKRNITKVSVINGTIPHKIIGKHGASRIFLKPAAPGTGIIAGAPVRAVMEQVGIHNILTKRQGSKNQMNLVHATMNALLCLKDAVSIANKRGMTIGEVFN